MISLACMGQVAAPVAHDATPIAPGVWDEETMRAMLSLLPVAPAARPGWDEETRIVMLKVMVGEAGYALGVDHPSMIAVLMKRNELPFWRDKPIREVAMAYSMVVKEGLPTNENRERTARVTRACACAGEPECACISAPTAIMALVDAVGDGTPLPPCRRPWEPGMLCDPCRGRAIHWGSVQDAHASPLATIACGRTRNVFLGTPPARRRPMAIPVNGVIPAREAH